MNWIWSKYCTSGTELNDKNHPLVNWGYQVKFFLGEVFSVAEHQKITIHCLSEISTLTENYDQVFSSHRAQAGFDDAAREYTNQASEGRVLLW